MFIYLCDTLSMVKSNRQDSILLLEQQTSYFVRISQSIPVAMQNLPHAKIIVRIEFADPELRKHQKTIFEKWLLEHHSWDLFEISPYAYKCDVNEYEVDWCRIDWNNRLLFIIKLNFCSMNFGFDRFKSETEYLKFLLVIDTVETTSSGKVCVDQRAQCEFISFWFNSTYLTQTVMRERECVRSDHRLAVMDIPEENGLEEDHDDSMSLVSKNSSSTECSSIDFHYMIPHEAGSTLNGFRNAATDSHRFQVILSNPSISAIRYFFITRKLSDSKIFPFRLTISKLSPAHFHQALRVQVLLEADETSYSKWLTNHGKTHRFAEFDSKKSNFDDNIIDVLMHADSPQSFDVIWYPVYDLDFQFLANFVKWEHFLDSLRCTNGSFYLKIFINIYRYKDNHKLHTFGNKLKICHALYNNIVTTDSTEHLSQNVWFPSILVEGDFSSVDSEKLETLSPQHNGFSEDSASTSSSTATQPSSSKQKISYIPGFTRNDYARHPKPS